MGSIYKMTVGQPEQWVPSRLKAPAKVGLAEGTQFPVDQIRFKTTAQGCALELPLEKDAAVFGFGLQLKGMNHKNRKKQVRPNADPVSTSGDTHAPVPFYVTNQGYGVYVDTARYASFYCGRTKNLNRNAELGNKVMDNTSDLYNQAGDGDGQVMLIEIPVAKGVDLYFIEGESITDIVSTYNLYSGGGCMPSLWGLGVLYRCCGKFTEDQVLEMADYLRGANIPCDILGLEPGWQSHSYSCSYVWDQGRYPNHQKTVDQLIGNHFHLNLWEHAFVNAASPIYEDMKAHCGDFEVWGGLVPDFADPEAVRIFGDYHKKVLTQKGITGFKLDECDGSDYTNGWTFPNSTAFPSGLDGEQMHSLFGTLYMKVLLGALGNQRTLAEVRNAGAFAAPYPFVLYSDLYDHKDFIRGLVNAGFSGLLWTPELRHAETKEDLIRRLQTIVFSPQALINAWYIEEVPWKKFDAEAETRELLQLRMSLLPYLYGAFYRYHTEGKAPVRALVSDYSGDSETYEIDDEYLFGDAMLVAPLVAGEEARRVYLPEGEWFDLWTNKKYAGGWHTVKTEKIPVFVKSGALIPWAKPVEYVEADTVFELTLKGYGEPGTFTVIEDDGETYTTKYKEIVLSMEQETESDRYRIVGKETIR